jgi:glycosyltransferase involved in cell wall biosynthesis
VRVAFPTPATFFDADRGGGGRYPLNLARGLVVASGGDVEVELIAPAASPGRREIEDGVWLRGYEPHPLTAPYGEALSWELMAAVISADVVHVHQVFTRVGEAAVLAARVARRPVCVTDHGGGTSRQGRKLGLAELADAIVAYSRYGAGAVGARNPVTIIEGGVDTRIFTPPDEEGGRDHVVYVGRLLPHKGVDLLIRACPEDVPLVIAGESGDSDYQRELRRIAQGRNVMFVSDPDDDRLIAIHRRALAVVLPSVNRDMYGAFHAHPELMGLSMLEGMACGAPAICFPVGGSPEYIEHGVTGFVVRDAEDLTRHIRLLASDPGRVRRMGSAARAQVAGRWDVATAGAALLGLYQRLLTG